MGDVTYVVCLGCCGGGWMMMWLVLFTACATLFSHSGVGEVQLARYLNTRQLELKLTRRRKKFVSKPLSHPR